MFSNFLFKLGKTMLAEDNVQGLPSGAHPLSVRSSEFSPLDPAKNMISDICLPSTRLTTIFHQKNARISSFSCQCHLCWFDIFCELNRCGWGWKRQSVRGLMTSAKYAHFVAESGKLCGAYTKGFTDKWIHVQQANDRCSCFFFLLIFYLRKMIHFDLILLMVQKSPTTTGLICLKPWRKIVL